MEKRNVKLMNGIEAMVIANWVVPCWRRFKLRRRSIVYNCDVIIRFLALRKLKLVICVTEISGFSEFRRTVFNRAQY